MNFDGKNSIKIMNTLSYFNLFYNKIYLLEHKVLKTEYSHLIVRCTATFKTITLPNTCVSSKEPGL